MRGKASRLQNATSMNTVDSELPGSAEFSSKESIAGRGWRPEPSIWDSRTSRLRRSQSKAGGKED
jgi:hypothetical protein